MNNPSYSKLTHPYIPRSIRAWWFLMLLLWVLPSKAQTSPGPGTLAVAGISESGGCSDMVDSLRFTFTDIPQRVKSLPVLSVFRRE